MGWRNRPADSCPTAGSVPILTGFVPGGWIPIPLPIRFLRSMRTIPIIIHTVAWLALAALTVWSWTVSDRVSRSAITDSAVPRAGGRGLSAPRRTPNHTRRLHPSRQLVAGSLRGAASRHPGHPRRELDRRLEAVVSPECSKHDGLPPDTGRIRCHRGRLPTRPARLSQLARGTRRPPRGRALDATKRR